MECFLPVLTAWYIGGLGAIFCIPVCCGTEVFACASALTSRLSVMWEALGANMFGYLKKLLVPRGRQRRISYI